MGLGDGLGHGARPGREASVFEDPHRAVPEHGAGIEHGVGEVGRAARADVETHPAVGDGRPELPDVAAGARVADLPARPERGDVGGEADGRTPVEQGLARGDHVVLAERRAHGVALGLQEREAHAATDEHLVGQAEERVDDLELVAHLGAPQHCDERPGGVLAEAEQHLHLGGEEAPGGAGEVLRGPDDGRVGAVRRSEGVVHVGVEAVDEPRDEGPVVALLPRVEPQVLEQLHPGASSASRARIGATE